MNRPPPMRRKLPSLTDYEPARERSPIEKARLQRLFPDTDEHGNPIPLEIRMVRTEHVLFGVVDAQIAAAPKIEAAYAYTQDETNARSSAMAYAERMSGLLVDVKRTQRVRESRSRLMLWALGAPVIVVVIGLWLKADVAALATATAAVAGVAIAIVQTVAAKSGRVREDDEIGSSVRPPKKG